MIVPFVSILETKGDEGAEEDGNPGGREERSSETPSPLFPLPPPLLLPIHIPLLIPILAGLLGAPLPMRKEGSEMER
jgi:hypothetical protein